MALPPERISIKRRRQDEPVDTLVLEAGSVQDKKRRFTDFIFQRLKTTKPVHNVAFTAVKTTDNSFNQNQAAAASNRQSSLIESNKAPMTGGTAQDTSQTNQSVTKSGQTPMADYHALGVPVVKATKPGDERKAYSKRTTTTTLPVTRAARDQVATISVQASTKDKVTTTQSTIADRTVATKNNIVPDTTAVISGIPAEKLKSARRFHLTRDISSALRPNSSSGIRRRKLNLRPPLATFIERQSAQHKSPARKIAKPIDSIVHVETEDQSSVLQAEASSQPVVASKTPVQTFQKSISTSTRDGHSIRDDPSTWDVGSDQLANELAALAFELDPDAVMETDVEELPAQTQQVEIPEPMVVDSDDDYVFETYVRVRHDADSETGEMYLGDEVGVLVINEEDHDLWEKYVHEDEDDDDDWDEEDEDSNAEDHPRNDYPEDEVSSDDEYGRNVYKYRRNASGDEEYDTASRW